MWDIIKIYNNYIDKRGKSFIVELKKDEKVDISLTKNRNKVYAKYKLVSGKF